MKRAREGEKENKIKNEEHTRKREHIPILEEKKKNMGKVQRMNRNVHDKKGYEEKEKDIDREGNKAGEAGYSKEVKKSFTLATVATATETREDPQELDKIPSTEGVEDIEWDDTEDDETEEDNLLVFPSCPHPANPG